MRVNNNNKIIDEDNLDDSATEFGKGGQMPGAQSDMQSEGSYMVKVGGVAQSDMQSEGSYMVRVGEHKVINDDESSMFGGS